MTLNSLVGTAVRNVTIDDSFSSRDVFKLAMRFRSLEPDMVEMLSLPTTDARLGDAAVLRLKQPDAREVIDHFLGRAPPPAAPGALPRIPPNTVRLQVLNGAGVDGQAGEAAEALQRAGFNVAGTGDADSFKYVKPVIRYGRGQEAKARLVQAHVAGGAQLTEDRTLLGADLVLVTGSGFQGIRSPTEPAPAAPGGPAATTPARPRGGPAQPQC